jgi:hypothetical protein
MMTIKLLVLLMVIRRELKTQSGNFISVNSSHRLTTGDSAHLKGDTKICNEVVGYLNELLYRFKLQRTENS